MLYPYDIPEANRPDIMVVLDASHAEAFNRAARAATTAMDYLMQSKGTLGILKTQQVYIAGPMDFKNNVIAGTACEEFGDHLTQNDERTTITELRNQMSGHIRVALNDIMSAAGVKSINLIFCAGGPLVILPPEPHKIAILRFEDAKSVQEERQCVIANKASRLAYQTAWTMIDEFITKHRPPEEPSIVHDIMAEPQARRLPSLSLVSAAEPISRPHSNHEEEDEEDHIDNMGGEADSVLEEGEPPASENMEDTSGGAFHEFDNVGF